MLRRLEIRDIVLIEALDLDFEGGLNVLTGETGAGKSILLDALGFALGRKGRRELIRAGADKGSVTAVFEPAPAHPVYALLDELDLAGEPGEVILRRVQSPGGPARGFVNDRRASAEVLRQIGALLVEVHGQHDDRGLLDPRAHRAMLDAFGGFAPQITTVRAAWSEAERAARTLEDARQRLAKAEADADYIRHSAEELSRFDPQVGEDDALDTERRRIQAAAQIRDEVAKAAEVLDRSAEAAMAEALSRLNHAAGMAQALLHAPIEAIDRAMVELSEAQRGAHDALAELNIDPNRLEQVEERLFALRALARKHNVVPDQLPDLAEWMTAQLDEIDGGAERLDGLEAAAEAAREVYEEAAARLTEERRAAGERLDRAVTGELAPLKMEAARFATRIEPERAGPEGQDRVSFTAAINPGTPAGPIDRIASGGELSRFLLALKVCLAARGPDLTLIFDEIDRGVGGATAAAVGRRLARLAEGAQVLVVTHSPQVAAQGHHHWRIAKTSTGSLTRTEVAPLSEDQRRDEIARMLAGEEITSAARSAADALIQQAR
ncbi:MAG: DNA repair protein RecN [Pseudomonadota bacterium]